MDPEQAGPWDHRRLPVHHLVAREAAATQDPAVPSWPSRARRARCEQLRDGNSTFDFMASVIRRSIRFGVPIIAENPHSPMAWSEPSMSKLLPKGREIVSDFCMFGMRWQKRTRFVGWSVVLPPPDLERKCYPVRSEDPEVAIKVCCRSGLPHIHLRGRQPRSNVLWTKVAEPYALPLAKLLVRWIVQSQQAHGLQHLRELVALRPRTCHGYGPGDHVFSNVR